MQPLVTNEITSNNRLRIRPIIMIFINMHRKHAP